MNQLKPKKRSKLRIKFGTLYYRFKRYLFWYFSNTSFAKVSDTQCTYLVKERRSPIYRKLKDTDMWLQENKRVNLEIAIPKINKVLIRPGETFSFWKLVGSVSKRKGYVDGMVLSHGKVITGIGGGMCQMTNMLYWIFIHSELTVTERYRHSYDVFPDSNRKVPFGSGATCLYNYRDIMVKNNSDVTYQLEVTIEDDYLVGKLFCEHQPIYTYQVYEKEHYFKHELWGAYTRHNLIHRYVIDRNEEIVDDEYVVENHALMMYAPFIEPPSSCE